VGLALLTLLLAALLKLALGRIAGDRLRGLRRVAAPPIAGAHLLVLAFVAQVIEPLLSRAVPYSYPVAFAVSATLMTQFVVRNAAVPGVALAGLGLVLNAAVVILNGAMPVSLDAAARAGLPVERLDLDGDPRHEQLDAATRLASLADTVPTPIPGRREVTSPGDILLAAGIGLFVFRMTRPRPLIRGDHAGVVGYQQADACGQLPETA
jgi:hypothetical protein